MQNEPTTPQSAPVAQATPGAGTPPPAGGPEAPKKSRKNLILAVVAVVALLIAGGLTFWHFHHSKPVAQTSSTKSSASTAKFTPNPNLPGLQLDPTKNYGNKYASGVLPVGDNKYSTDSPSAGNVYVCSQYAQNLKASSGGAGTRGPWFSADGTTYDLNKKAHVSGSVSWTPSFSNNISGTTRTISTNDLPSHPTGVFPIQRSDAAAYAVDKNPNSIKAQSLTYALTTGPVYSATPHCMGGQSGIMLDGVALFNGFDAAGRDAGAWEVQDNCDGHPESQGEYHYHTLSSCITNVSVKTVIGYALDGYPITGPQLSSTNILTTANLDECHGITSQIVLDGKNVTMYHYVMTQDFPYSISCFRSTPINPPGMPSGDRQHP